MSESITNELKIFMLTKAIIRKAPHLDRHEVLSTANRLISSNWIIASRVSQLVPIVYRDGIWRDLPPDGYLFELPRNQYGINKTAHAVGKIARRGALLNMAHRATGPTPFKPGTTDELIDRLTVGDLRPIGTAMIHGAWPYIIDVHTGRRVSSPGSKFRFYGDREIYRVEIPDSWQEKFLMPSEHNIFHLPPI